MNPVAAAVVPCTLVSPKSNHWCRMRMALELLQSDEIVVELAFANVTAPGNDVWQRVDYDSQETSHVRHCGQ